MQAIDRKVFVCQVKSLKFKFFLSVYPADNTYCAKQTKAENFNPEPCHPFGNMVVFTGPAFYTWSGGVEEEE